MRVAIMEPYFFPYLGHFDLLNHADAWIAFDTVQYTRHRFGNRNRILHPHRGWQYVIVPVVKQPRETHFSRTLISDHLDWRGRILRQLAHYEPHAPYYREVIEFVEECFSGSVSFLSKFTTDIFRKTCERLGLDRPVHLLSEMNLTLGPINGPGDWGLEIALAVGANEFINPCGGSCILDANYYRENGVRLILQSYQPMLYDTGKYQFEPNLSILDVMMWNSPREIKHYLDSYHRGYDCEDEDRAAILRVPAQEAQDVPSP